MVGTVTALPDSGVSGARIYTQSGVKTSNSCSPDTQIALDVFSRQLPAIEQTRRTSTGLYIGRRQRLLPNKDNTTADLSTGKNRKA